MFLDLVEMDGLLVVAVVVCIQLPLLMFRLILLSLLVMVELVVVELELQQVREYFLLVV